MSLLGATITESLNKPVLVYLIFTDSAYEIEKKQQNIISDKGRLTPFAVWIFWMAIQQAFMAITNGKPNERQC